MTVKTLMMMMMKTLLRDILSVHWETEVCYKAVVRTVTEHNKALLTNLKLNNFKIIEAMGLKINASRSP
jgi:hypothetical protein